MGKHWVPSSFTQGVLQYPNFHHLLQHCFAEAEDVSDTDKQMQRLALKLIKPNTWASEQEVTTKITCSAEKDFRLSQFPPRRN